MRIDPGLHRGDAAAVPRLSDLPQPRRHGVLGAGRRGGLLLLADPRHQPPLAGGGGGGSRDPLPLPARRRDARARPAALRARTRRRSASVCGTIPTATLVLELATLAAGRRGVRRAFAPAGIRSGRGVWRDCWWCWSAIYLASVFGPPPPSVTAIAVVDIIGLLLLLAFAAWMDRRATRPSWRRPDCRALAGWIACSSRWARVGARSRSEPAPSARTRSRARLSPELLAVFETGGALSDVSRARPLRRGVGRRPAGPAPGRRGRDGCSWPGPCSSPAASTCWRCPAHAGSAPSRRSAGWRSSRGGPACARRKALRYPVGRSSPGRSQSSPPPGSSQQLQISNFRFNSVPRACATWGLR